MGFLHKKGITGRLPGRRQLGDHLTDNSRRTDAYRFHDAIHLGFMAVLGWSPTMRALLRIKRKSNPDTDEVEDGARAIFAEEGLAAALSRLARRRAGFLSETSVDGEVLDVVKAVVTDLEVEPLPGWLWRSAISQGFRALRQLGEPEDRLFQVIAFRTFSKIDTWRAVQEQLGRSPTLDDLADGSFTRALEHARQRNGGLYTGAFILCATDAYGQPFKHLNHVELFRHMFLHDRLGDRLLDAKSLREAYELLHGYPLMGDFMSYQTAIDLNYSDLLGLSENDFTQAGPGALRGMKKAFESMGDYTPTEVILWMVQRQEEEEEEEEEFGRLGLGFNGLWGRALHAIDCQGLFCELDKYCREAAPELSSARRRIKARFAPSPEPIQLFFPPKWGINANLPHGHVLGTAPVRTALQERLF